jgi:1-acyl-sn-glycerol-3-phosphate acyltransferase
MPDPRTSRLTQLSRGIRLIGKLSKGLVLIWFVFPRINPVQRDGIIERWCREVLEVLAIRLTLHGDTPPGRVSSVLFVANHVSWLDILVINACRRVRFVAKTEVRQWPLIGWMAAQTGTLFLKRSSLRELGRVTEGMSALLRRGDCVALFPEGTTTDGTSLQTFHSGLFESAIAAEALVWPVAIHYRRQNGARDCDVAFVGDQSLVCSIKNVLARPSTQAWLSFAAPLESSAGDRRALTGWCQQAIERSLAGHRQLPTCAGSLLRRPADDSFPPLTAA